MFTVTSSGFNVRSSPVLPPDILLLSLQTAKGWWILEKRSFYGAHSP